MGRSGKVDVGGGLPEFVNFLRICEKIYDNLTVYAY